MSEKLSVKDVLKKHSARIEEQIKGDNFKGDYSREYEKFKEEMSPEFSRYEKWGSSLGSFIKINASKKDEEKIKRYLQIAHLDIEPWQALTLSIMAFLGVFIIGILISVAIVLIKNDIAAFPFLFFFLIIIFSLFLFYFVNGYPQRLANKWRLKASSQMVPAILYIVVYMRHTPNLEKAVAFASKHLQNPLALDFKKIFYNVEVGKFSTIKESLDNYLETWRDYSLEFIESFHLIESSLFEPSNEGRIATLEKSLQVVLDGVYDKMLAFTHNVRSPLTNVYMLGVVLPTLGLALLPLASAMMGGLIKWYHILILFNLIIPFFVFYLTDKVMMLRPGGHGETNLIENNPYYYKYKSNAPYFRAFLICLPLLIIGLIPFLFQYTSLPSFFGLHSDYTFSEFGIGFLGQEKIFDFKETGFGFVGPFGIVALLFGMFIPLSITLFFSISYNSKTKELIKERARTKQLEVEFNNSLFQLGNRIGNGTPPELVFGKVAESSKGLMTEDFFKRVNYNIQQMGMSVEKSIFDSRRGAIVYYPSDLIATSMGVLVESSKKGLKIAAISLMSISEYVKNIHKITARLKDLLAEIVSDMKSNMTFLAPLLAGIVIGLSAMIASILNKLSYFAESGGETTGLGGIEGILSVFDLIDTIPPYYLQIAIGIYLIQIIFILTNTLVIVDFGEDKLEKMNKTSKNLIRGIVLYLVTALLSTIVLFVLVNIVIGV